MALAVGSLVSPQTWPVSVLVLVLTTFSIAIYKLASRPSWPVAAPKIEKGWPVLGSLGFWGERLSFLKKGSSTTKTGHFSFYTGSRPVVALFGTEARQTFFSERRLNPSAGYAALFHAAAMTDHLQEGETDMETKILNYFRRFLNKEALSVNLHNLITDSTEGLQSLDIGKPLDPFEFMYRIIYQLSHRTLSCNDVADDPVLLEKSLKQYLRLDEAVALEVIFPKLPVPSRLRKMWSGLQMHLMFKKVMDERRRTGHVGTDTMQTLMDAGESDTDITTFIISALFAGLINSGSVSSWIPCQLANNPEWKQLVREEVDAIIAKHRLSESESPLDTLARLSLDNWETSFPKLEMCISETIRLNLSGTALRQNRSDKNIKIGGCEEIIPNGAFVAYPIADLHLNPEIYPDPDEWNPSRFMPENAESIKRQSGFAGWGLGLHPCLGMKFAKLEIVILISTFMAMFDYETCDKNGNKTDQLPGFNHQAFSSQRYAGKVYLKCKPRI